jgi:hypothetical protein
MTGPPRAYSSWRRTKERNFVRLTRGGVLADPTRAAHGHPAPAWGMPVGPFGPSGVGLQRCPLGHKRERERERCGRLLPHLGTHPWRVTDTPVTFIPLELTRKRLPLRSRPGPSPRETPVSTAKVDHWGRPQPDHYVWRPRPVGSQGRTTISTPAGTCQAPTERGCPEAQLPTMRTLQRAARSWRQTTV